jgi:hypothetical protein
MCFPWSELQDWKRAMQMRRVVNWCLRGLNAILVGAGIPVAVVYGMQQQGEL